VIDDGRLLGAIWPEDVIERYNTEIFKRDMASSMASAVSAETRPSTVPAAGDTVVAEVPVPGAFLGRTIRALDIRQRFGVSVLMVKHRPGAEREGLTASPDPDYRFSEDDLLLVLGSQDDVRDLKRGRPRSKT
jgi:trk system potassium uptake protein TrkA